MRGLRLDSPWLTARLLAYRGRPSFLARGIAWLAAVRDAAVWAWVQPDPAEAWESRAQAAAALPREHVCQRCGETYDDGQSFDGTELCGSCCRDIIDRR